MGLLEVVALDGVLVGDLRMKMMMMMMTGFTYFLHHEV